MPKAWASDFTLRPELCDLVSDPSHSLCENSQQLPQVVSIQQSTVQTAYGTVPLLQWIAHNLLQRLPCQVNAVKLSTYYLLDLDDKQAPCMLSFAVHKALFDISAIL